MRKAGLQAKGTGQFSLLLGEDGGPEIALDVFWELYQESQDPQVFATVVELARRMMNVGPEAGLGQLYPYVMPEEYLAHWQTEPPGMVRPLGHGLHVGLVFEFDGLVQSVGTEALQRLGLTPEEAHARAIGNLAALAREQAIQFALFGDGASGRRFIVVCDHWASATAILLPKLRQVVAGPLETTDILVSIPHREAMLLFPNGDRAHRDAFRAMVREKESDGRKPLTFELFALTDDGVKPFQEEP